MREDAERIRRSAEHADAEMVNRIAGLRRFDDTLANRIADGEKRLGYIERELGSFFSEG